jgi:ABC-type lipoprotein export system ATPase subunit
MIQSITLLGGKSRSGEAEPVQRVDMKMGDVVSVVGPTGSGKTTLINDIELFADRNTQTGRAILINDRTPPYEYRDNPASNPIALITQHTTFLSDLPVGEFLTTHARIRTTEHDHTDLMVEQTLAFANQLTGEPVQTASRMTELSGGQTRALLIADATIICNTPIVLLDEVENAGIHRSRTLELLRQYRKIFIFVTHDPHIALLSDYRIVMQGGSMTHLIHTTPEERVLSSRVGRLDDVLTAMREKIRLGYTVDTRDMEGV